MNEPLVSVIVATYNSEDTIIDTLESVKQQTYKNIELIITDDLSTDNTVQYVRDWLLKNRSCFTKVRLLKARKNAGVTRNCNRAILSSSGKYVKTVGGDDRLLLNCISDNVEFLENHDFQVVLSRYAYRGNKKTIQSLEKDLRCSYKLLQQNEQEKLRKKSVKAFSMPTSTSVFSRKLLDEMNLFDERLPFWEDIPFFYKLIENRVDIGFFDKETFEYYLHDESLSHEFTNNQKLSYSAYMHLKDHISIFYLYELQLLLKYKEYGVLLEKYKSVNKIKIQLLKHLIKTKIG